MLEELIIKNYALAENLRIEFSCGFNILSGETGAGKSVIIGALNLVLGGVGNVSSIRTGASEADVSAVIDVSGNKEALLWLENNNISLDDGKIILRRVLKKNGRSSIYLQSFPLTKADTIALTSLLFDIHGQNEHQSLLSVDNQLRLLDSFAGIKEDVEGLKRYFFELGRLRKELQEILVNERDAEREADIAAFSVKEIEDANLSEGEIESLEEEHKMLSQAERVSMIFEDIYSSLSEAEGGAIAGLRKGVESLRALSRIKSDMSESVSRLESAFFETEDVFDGIVSFKNNFDYSPERLAICEERLAEIQRLRKKYGNTVSDIFQCLENSKKILENVSNSNDKKELLSNNIESLEKKVLTLAREISAKRKEAALRLQKAVQDNLFNLGMPKAVFVIKVEQRLDEKNKPSCSSNGLDKIEFLISPNQGEPPKRLRAIASGGETSRIMLAIKSVLSEIDSVDCLVFDEIDSGIGGEIAVTVGEHLYRLSRNKQILCISHLASIAVRADNHIRVVKKTFSGRTFTEIKTIAGEDRTREIARMLSGDVDAEVSLKHAEDLLLKATES